MTEKEIYQASIEPTPAFRLDGRLHDALMQLVTRPGVKPSVEPQSLPEPVFPLHPDAAEKERSSLSYHWLKGRRAVQCWLVPYLKSLRHSQEFRPILSYLLTEWKCNLDCHYCWAFNNRIKGMSEDTAKRSIDWLHSTGCRVLAIMGGEPLLRPDFIHKVVYYGARNGFFVYVPTNGRLMRPEVIDRIGDAGVATINLAVDCVDEKPGLPKALNSIRPYFDHLVKVQRRYGYMVVFNINITRINTEDVKVLTEIAYDNGISTDYHINETPLIEQSHFKHLDENSTYLRPEDYPKVDDLLDYLIDRYRQGYIMVNSKRHLADMKDFMRGRVKPWQCYAGQHTLVIRTDGTLAPCFAMYSAMYDWGTIENYKFDIHQLDEMKKVCNAHCLSTCQYIVGYYYDHARVLRWLIPVIKQVLHGHQGAAACGGGAGLANDRVG